MKVRYSPNNKTIRFKQLIIGNVYDVIEFIPRSSVKGRDFILIRTERDLNEEFPLNDYFVDVTIDYRNEIINDILK